MSALLDSCVAAVAPSPPLWQSLLLSARVVQRVCVGGESATRALQDVPGPQRATVLALTGAAWRHWGSAQWLRRQLAARKPPPALDALLCTALALRLDAARTPYAAHTWVHQATEAAKRDPSTRHQAAFVNGCLRRYLAQEAHWQQRMQQDPVARWNHPLWWQQRLQRDWPEHWAHWLTLANQPAPMVLRVNRRRQTVAGYQALLAARGMVAHALPGDGLWLAQPCPVEQLPGFEQGWVSVQDGAAQWAAPWLLQGLQPAQAGARLRLLDACAAPGGKTAHLLELADADVLALEWDAQRAQRIPAGLQRLGLQAEVRVADASQPSRWWDGKLFDGVLLDAPCSASGIVRRHPDIRWLRREADVAALAARQDELLQRLWPLVRPGGRLLYCTCSVFRAEGADRIDAFLARTVDAQLDPASGHRLQPPLWADAEAGDNTALHHDGFFYALLHKRPL